MTDLFIAIAFGGVIGFLAGMLPRKKAGCAVLFSVPLGMIFYTRVELSRANHHPDALDSLAYVFLPLWPSLAALTGRLVYKIMGPKRPR